MIDAKDWKWFGFSGHFICGTWCRFHLCTQVGDFLVSTVGKLVHPKDSAGSEVTESEYLQENPNGADIGHRRKYETMVFRTNGKVCRAAGCGCGLPGIISQELESEGYNNPEAATRGHMKLCMRVAKGEINVCS